MKYLLLCGLISMLAQPLHGQSLDTTDLPRVTRLMQQMDSTHKADSLRRVALQAEIQALTGSQQARHRDALMAKLKAMVTQDSLHQIKRRHQLQAMKASSHGAPVAPFGDTLFMVYTRVGSFGPEDRVKAISEKIVQLYEDFKFQPDSLQVSISEMSPEIVFHDQLIMSINELEAMWYEEKPVTLAIRYRDIIRQAIRSEREEHSLTSLLTRVASILLILLGIYVMIRLINKLFKRILVRLARLKGNAIRGIRIKGYQLLDSARELKVIVFLVNILRLFIIALTLYIALPLLFSVFPWTRSIADKLIDWILSPVQAVLWGLIHYLPNLFAIAVILAVTHYVIKFLGFIAGEIESQVLNIQGFYPDWAKPTFNIVRFLLWVFSFIVIFPYLPGSDSPVFRGVSVFLGVIFSLGSSSAISNAVAGLVITYMRPFKVGDRVKIGDVSGDVVEKSMLVTRIRTIKNEEITIPNSTILTGHTINYTTSAQERGLILHSTVTIGYDAPWKQVHELLIAAALKTTGIFVDENHRPFVFQTSLDDFYVAYQINLHTQDSQQMTAIYSSLHQNIQDAFNEAGVEIMSPHYRSARDGNRTTVPASYLPADYQAPTFKVSTDSTDASDKKTQ